MQIQSTMSTTSHALGEVQSKRKLENNKYGKNVEKQGREYVRTQKSAAVVHKLVHKRLQQHYL